MRGPLGGRRKASMHRIAAAMIPVFVTVAASVWLYGWPGPRQRLQAPRLRHHVVLGIALSSIAAATLTFIARVYTVEKQISSDAALSLFLGLILVSVGLLYALLPPHRDL